MLNWMQKHPKADFEAHFGAIPYFLSEADAAPAAVQLDKGYSHGGGWKPLPRWTLLPDGRIQYPGDPPETLLFEAKLRAEVIRVYTHSWVAIVQPDGSFEVSRMD